MFKGPVFNNAFLSYRPFDWIKGDSYFGFLKKNNGSQGQVGTAGIQTNVIAAPRHSSFMEFTLNSLRENFPTKSATLYKTGPYFFKEAFLQYPYNDKIQLIRFELCTLLNC